MKKRSSVNYGIQSDNVWAGAVAGGPHAIAVSFSGREQVALIAKLSEDIRHLGLSFEREKSILEHLETLKTQPSVDRASTLDKVVSGLKEAGHLAELMSPLKALAAAFGLSLPF
jgi:hypothetical protein